MILTHMKMLDGHNNVGSWWHISYKKTCKGRLPDFEMDSDIPEDIIGRIN